MQSYLLLYFRGDAPEADAGYGSSGWVPALAMRQLQVVARKAAVSHCFTTDTRTNNVWVKKWKLELWESTKPLTGLITSYAAPQTRYSHPIKCIAFLSTQLYG